MNYRKVTLMPPQGLVLERAAVLCGIVEPSNHEQEDILYFYFMIRFFFLPDFPNWTCSSMPQSGVPCVCQTLLAFCGCSTWIQFYKCTRGAAELGGMETTQTMGSHQTLSWNDSQWKFWQKTPHTGCGETSFFHHGEKSRERCGQGQKKLLPHVDGVMLVVA